MPKLHNPKKRALITIGGLVGLALLACTLSLGLSAAGIANSATLELQLEFPPRPRMPLEEQWVIPLPAQWVESVEKILPLLAPGQENHTST